MEIIGDEFCACVMAIAQRPTARAMEFSLEHNIIANGNSLRSTGSYNSKKQWFL